MKPIVLAVVSDVHAGSTVAVAPPVVRLDDGGEYRASKAQLWLWQCWQDYWKRVAEVRKEAKASLYTIFNGDLLDGDHHNTSQILSRNPEAQSAVLRACMEAPLSLKPDKIFVVRGTEAHNGKSNAGEEGVARRWRDDGLPVVGDDDTGTASHWHLRRIIGGVRLDVAHHGRTGQRAHTEGNAANLYAHDILLHHAKDGDPHPDLVFRGHYHRFNDSYDMCPVRVVTTGAFQLATGYVHKVAPDSLATIGGAIVVIRDGSYTVEKLHFRARREWKADD